MAEGGRLEKSMIKHVREEFTCAVCCELFNTPKTLSCLHTFCAKCLEASEAARRRIRGKEDHEYFVECPFCLTVSKYAGGLNSIITNFVYKNVVEHLKVHNQVTSRSSEEEPWCGKCQQKGEEAKPAVSYCYDCQALLCMFCESMHKKTVDLAEHHMCSLEEIRQNKLPVSTTSWPKGDNVHYCSRHNDPFRLYCYTCHEVICRDCVVKKEDHREHSYEFISEIIEKERINLLHSIEPLESMKEHFTCCSNRITAHQEELDRKHEQRSFRINCALDEALEQMEVRRGQLHEEARKDHEIKCKNVALDLEHVEVVKSSMESVAEFTHTTIDKCSDTEVLIYKKGILARLETLKQKFTSYQSFEVGGTDAVDFMYDLKPIGEFGMLCEVPDLQTSNTLGEGLDCPMQDEETSFIVQARGGKGEPLLRGGGSCSVLITASPAPLGQLEVVSNTVIDNYDGTYAVSYRPTYPGINRVAVQFDGQDIKGSPFSVNVKRNYNRPIGEPQVFPLPNASPLGVAMITDSKIAVTASDSVVRVYDINGTELNPIQSELLRPYGIITDFENCMWITDRETHTIQKYRLHDDGTFVKLFHFGSRGIKCGTVLTPSRCGCQPSKRLHLHLGHEEQQDPDLQARINLT